uniref:DDE Tnp4 domain-containing protein n=1 Tax=Mesocestoides corti TaxID=53468 RepID=A0A5K3FZW3_MESCO
MQDRRSRWEKMDEGGNEAAAGAADSLSQRAGVHEGAASSPPLQELLSALITEGLCSHRAGANLKTSHCDTRELVQRQLEIRQVPITNNQFSTVLNNPNQNALNSQAPFQVISEFAFEYFIEDKTAIAHYSTALDEASAKQHYGVFVATTMSTSIDLDVFTHFGSNSNQPGLNPHVGELGLLDFPHGTRKSVAFFAMSKADDKRVCFCTAPELGEACLGMIRRRMDE